MRQRIQILRETERDESTYLCMNCVLWLRLWPRRQQRESTDIYTLRDRDQSFAIRRRRRLYQEANANTSIVL